MANYLVKCKLDKLNTKNKESFFKLFENERYKKSIKQKRENFLIITSQLFSFLQLDLEEDKHFKKVYYDLVNINSDKKIEPIVMNAKMASDDYDKILRTIYN